MKRLLFGVLLALVGSLLYPVAVPAERENAREQTIEIKNTATSSFFTGYFSFDGKALANYAIFAGEGNMGKVTGQGISQNAPTGRTCTLPDGSSGIELTLVGHVASTKFDRTGDLLLEKGGPGALVACLNTTAVPMTFHEEGTTTIIGGTGRFSGASGTEAVVQDGVILEGRPPVPGAPPGSFSAFGFSHGTFTIRITVPK